MRVCPCPEAIYKYMTIISNIFFSETVWPIKAKLYMETSWKEGTYIYKRGLGHVTRMAAMSIYGQNFKKKNLHFLEPEVLGMDRLGLNVFKIYINDDPGLVLTHFTARFNLVKIANCSYTRPRCQGSVYMTIGPLVCQFPT